MFGPTINFTEIAEQVKITSIKEANNLIVPNKVNPYKSERYNKWMLVSQMQKAIRRGYTEIAYYSAVRILEIDPEYLFRRLIIIAFEDVALGDYKQVCKAVHVSAYKRTRNAIKSEKAAAYYIVKLLSKSAKDRSCTDATLAANHSYEQDIDHARDKYFYLYDEDLQDIALNEQEPFLKRVIALQYLLGVNEYNAKHLTNYKIRQGDPQVWLETTCKLIGEGHPELKYLAQLGMKRCGEPLVTSIGLLSDSYRDDERDMLFFDSKPEKVDGILYEALDWHVGEGKRSLGYFKKMILDDLPEALTTFQLGMLVFRIEGHAVDVRLWFETCEYLYKHVDEHFLLSIGIKNPSKCLSIVQDNMYKLNEARDRIMAAKRNMRLR